MFRASFPDTISFPVFSVGSVGNPKVTSFLKAPWPFFHAISLFVHFCFLSNLYEKKYPSYTSNIVHKSTILFLNASSSLYPSYSSYLHVDKHITCPTAIELKTAYLKLLYSLYFIQYANFNTWQPIHNLYNRVMKLTPVPCSHLHRKDNRHKLINHILNYDTSYINSACAEPV
jgi:hypothetical protein